MLSARDSYCAQVSDDQMCPELIQRFIKVSAMRAYKKAISRLFEIRSDISLFQARKKLLALLSAKLVQ